jgi:hypothetical protein
MIQTLVGLMFLLLFGTQSMTVSAANAQPTPVGTPAAVACSVQPRTVAAVNEVASTAGTPIPGTPVPDLDDAISYVRPDGAPATEEAIAGVTDTINQFRACIVATDYLRFLALFSDDFIRTYIDDFDIPLEEDDPILTPSPEPDGDQIRVANIADLIELPDGRVNALVTFAIADESEEPIRFRLTLVYDENRERWLIDDLRMVLEEGEPTAWTLVQGKGYEGVIASEAGAKELTDFYVGGAPVENFWTPTEEDIAALERSLPVYIQTEGANVRGVRPDFINRLPEYKRQYAGFIQSDRRLILVNATCTDNFDWQSQPVFVMDGGDCFFRIIYDPEAGTFEGFEVNGEA